MGVGGAGPDLPHNLVRRGGQPHRSWIEAGVEKHPVMSSSACVTTGPVVDAAQTWRSVHDAFAPERRSECLLHVLVVEDSTRPIPPAGSTLPRLAAQLPARLLLMDPYQGAAGLIEQLGEAVELLGADQIVMVDVGGDIVARGDEPGLKGPVADILALVASVS